MGTSRSSSSNWFAAFSPKARRNAARPPSASTPTPPPPHTPVSLTESLLARGDPAEKEQESSPVARRALNFGEEANGVATVQQGTRDSLPPPGDVVATIIETLQQQDAERERQRRVMEIKQREEENERAMAHRLVEIEEEDEASVRGTGAVTESVHTLRNDTLAGSPNHQYQDQSSQPPFHNQDSRETLTGGPNAFLTYDDASPPLRPTRETDDEADIEDNGDAIRKYATPRRHGPSSADSSDSSTSSLSALHAPRAPLTIPQGHSTLFQTTMSTSNVMLGMAILAIPYAVSRMGWVAGLSMLVVFALVCARTARILGRCIEVADDEMRREDEEEAAGEVRRRAYMATGALRSYRRRQQGGGGLRLYSGDGDAGGGGAAAAGVGAEGSSSDANETTALLDYISTTARAGLKRRRRPLMSLSDIAAFAFGPGANTVVAVLFSLELLTVCTSLVIVTADTLAELFPHHTHHKKKMIKAVIAAIFTVTTLWKRRTPATGGSPRKWGWIMGVVSLTGVVTIVNMVGIVLFEGLIKAERPGSLWDWEETRLAPSVGIVGSFMSAGLFIVNLDAHAVFAGTYRDLKEPKDFPRVINRAYMLNVSVYILLGVAAYLMYGSHVMPEITANLPRDSFAVVTLVLIAVNPFTKYALLLRPVTAQLEAAFPAMFGHHDERGATYRTTPLGRLRGPLLRIALGLLVLGVSIAFPSFVRIIGLMGSLFSFGLAVVLPSLCHLEILGSRGLLGFMDGLVSVLLVVCGTVLAIGGTWASVVPYK